MTKGYGIIFITGFLGAPNEFQNIRERLSLPSIEITPLDIYNELKELGINEDAFFQNMHLAISNIATKNGLKKYIIYGYSMGGRMAMSSLIPNTSDTLLGLIIESASPGIPDSERETRISKDKIWGKRFSEEKPQEVLGSWYQLPVFNGFSETEKLLQIENRKNTNLSLYGKILPLLSPVVMPNLIPYLKKCRCPTLILTGNKDPKYQKLWELAFSSSDIGTLKNVTKESIANAGHNIHSVRPLEILTVLQDFLKTIESKINQPL